MEELSELKMRVGDIDKNLSEVKTIIAMRDTKWEELHLKVAMIYEFLIGSTDSEKPSMMLRLDRLEQVEKERRWVWLTVGALVINAAWSWLKGK